MVCRLCPLLLEAAVETARGVSEGGQLRTEVSWGTDAPQFGFRHTARLSSAGCAAARGEPQELVLEMWRLSGDTQAEELVGLVRSPLRLPTTAAMLGTRLYASSLVDGDEPIVHPLDGLARGELRVRVRVGTADQILRTRTLTGAVEVIQTAWRARCGDKREVAAAEAAANAAAQKAAAVWAAAAAAAAEAAAPPGTLARRYRRGAAYGGGGAFAAYGGEAQRALKLACAELEAAAEAKVAEAKEAMAAAKAAMAER